MRIDIADVRYRWVLLALAALTNMLVVAVSSISLSVMMPDISKELGLTIVQAGWVWGINSLPAIVTGFLGGALGDKFGPKRLLVIACLVAGITGALRGVATDFYSLALVTFLYGVMTPMITMNNLKIAGLWFHGKHLGLASGILAGGMALGFLVGSVISNTILSPWLGSWRNVFYFLGALSVLLTIPWLFIRKAPQDTGTERVESTGTSMLKGMKHVVKIRDLWLIGISALAINGAMTGLMGYTPLYLDGLGWNAVQTAKAVGLYTLASVLFVIPMSLWSDRLGSRKLVLVIAIISTSVGLFLMGAGTGSLIWLALFITGYPRDGYMSVMLASVMEHRQVGRLYTGTASGFMIVFVALGSLLAPPIGNSMAALFGGMPYIFWGLLAAAGLVCLLFTRSDRREKIDL